MQVAGPRKAMDWQAFPTSCVHQNAKELIRHIYEIGERTPQY